MKCYAVNSDSLSPPEHLCCFVCSGMAQSLGMGSGQTSGLHHASMKYSDQPQGPDTFTDFVTLVCQEAQSSQNQVHTLCLTHTWCLVSHPPCVMSHSHTRMQHTHPVSCLVTHAPPSPRVMSHSCTHCVMSLSHARTNPVSCLTVTHMPCVMSHSHNPPVSCFTVKQTPPVSCLTVTHTYAVSCLTVTHTYPVSCLTLCGFYHTIL